MGKKTKRKHRDDPPSSASTSEEDDTDCSSDTSSEKRRNRRRSDSSSRRSEKEKRKRRKERKERERDRRRRKSTTKKKKRGYDYDSESDSDSGSEETVRRRVKPEAVAKEMLKEFPGVGGDLKQLLQMIDGGQAVDIKGISEKLLAKHLKKLFISLKLKENGDRVFLLPLNHPPTLEILGSLIEDHMEPKGQQPDAAATENGVHPLGTDEESRRALDHNDSPKPSTSADIAGPRRRVIGPEMPSSELLAAAAKFSGVLRPHRKPLLKSETYFSLVLILSLCDDHPHLWQLAPKLPPQEKNPDSNSSKVGGGDIVALDSVDDTLTEKGQARDQNLACLVSDSGGFGETKAAIEGQGFSETKLAAVHEIECIMGLDEDEDEDLLMQDGSFIDKVMEFDHVMKVDNTLSVDDYQSDSVVVRKEGCVDIQSVNAEGRVVSEQQVQEEGHTRDVSDPLGSLSGEGGTFGASAGSYQNGVKLKEIDLDKPICDSSTTVSSNCVVVNGEVEEGGIDRELVAGERSSILHSKHAGVLQGENVDEKQLANEAIPGRLNEKKVDEKQLASDSIAGSRRQTSTKTTTMRNQSPSYEINESTKDTFCSTSLDRVENFDLGKGTGNKHEVGKLMLPNRKTVVYDDLLFDEGPKMWENEELCRDKGAKNKSKIAERKKNGRGREVGEVKGKQLKMSVAKSDVRPAEPFPSSLALPSGTSCQDPTGSQGAASQEKDASPSKNKKRGPPSDSQKLKRKQNKRKKRAEKNKELGVKRLKLQPFVKQKPVEICRHYMLGKCWESEKCKFSHDAIPLTKSEPCKFFVRGACMKGDDCLRDHELSKYPCDNFKSKGYCSRGQKCMFSHKLLPNGEVSTASSVNPNSLVLSRTLDSKKKLDVVAPLHQSGKTAIVPAAFSSTEIAQAPGKTVFNEPVIVPTFKLSLGGSSHIDQPSPGIIGDSNSALKVTPQAVRPKGMNFLSFGKSPLEFSAAKKSSVSPATRDDASKAPLLNTSSLLQQIPGVKPGINDMAQKSDHIAASGILNPFSLGATSAVDGNRHVRCHLPSSSGHGVASTGQGSNIDLDKNQSLSAVPLGLASSSFGSGQSSDHIALLQLKNAPKSTQEALMSTMSFASKLESAMKKKQKETGFGSMS